MSHNLSTTENTMIKFSDIPSLSLDIKIPSLGVCHAQQSEILLFHLPRHNSILQILTAEKILQNHTGPAS